MKTYYWYKEHGICAKCGHEPAMPNRVLCFECSYKDLIYRATKRKALTKEQKAKDNAQHRAKREQRRANGLCTTCGGALYDKRYKTCLECRIKDRRRKREEAERKYLERDGLCRRCDNKVQKGETLCQECLEKRKAIALANLEKANANRNNSYWRALNNGVWQELKHSKADKEQATC